MIKIFKKPFIGDEISIKDDLGRIFFGGKDFFKSMYSSSEIICEKLVWAAVGAKSHKQVCEAIRPWKWFHSFCKEKSNQSIKNYTKINICY